MIDDSNWRSTARIGGRPIQPVFAQFPVVCFIGTLITDLAYWKTAAVEWETFSIWLLTAGLVMAAFAVLAGLIDYFGNRRVGNLGVALWRVGLNALVIVLSIVNAFVHSRDGYTAVVPTGLTLSAIVVLLLLLSGWIGWSTAYREPVGVAS